jgi:probable addiction module antidote protein
MPLKDYNETYAARMRDKEYLDAYLEACLAEGPEAFYVGLRRAVQARENGFTWLAAQTGMGRESLYRALSADGNPSFRTILKVMCALGADASLLAHVGTEHGMRPESQVTNAAFAA